MTISDFELGALAAATADELGVPGAQISVLHRGQLIEGVAGVANVETGVPVTVDTLFSIGSTTKIYTASLVMQLVEEGSVGIDTPVVRQLPDFVLPDCEVLRALTPRHLMSMSSGLDNGPYTDFGPGNGALARYVAVLADIPPVFRPGEGYGYSNASSIVSGRLTQHVTGKPWEQVLMTRLLEPAGLADSAVSAEEVIHRRFASGHELDETGRPRVLHRWALPRSMAPAGGILATATDMVRFAHLFLHDGVSLDGQQRVLAPQTVTAMQAREVLVPPTLAAEWWGLGPYGKTWDGVEICGHSGTTAMGSSYLLWSVQRDLAIATTVNLPRFGYPFAARVFKKLFYELGGIRLPARPKPSADVKVDSARLVGRYAMSGITLTISEREETIMISAQGDTVNFESAPPSPLIPLTSTTFLTTDPAIDGNRGWALAFIGPEDSPPTHLLNGLFALRRIAD